MSKIKPCHIGQKFKENLADQAIIKHASLIIESLVALRIKLDDIASTGNASVAEKDRIIRPKKQLSLINDLCEIFYNMHFDAQLDDHRRLGCLNCMSPISGTLILPSWQTCQKCISDKDAEDKIKKTINAKTWKT